jgi:hypothetical protein
MRAPFALRKISSPVSTGSMPTPMENIVISGLFEEIRILTRKKHVNIAVFGWSLYFATYFILWKGTKGCRKPSGACQYHHVGNQNINHVNLTNTKINQHFYYTLK